MAYEQRDMSGSLFKNDRKEKDTHPNLQGSALIDGVAYYVSGWTKDSETKGKWISLSFKRKDAGGDAKEPARRAAREPDPIDDSMPF